MELNIFVVISDRQKSSVIAKIVRVIESTYNLKRFMVDFNAINTSRINSY